MNTGRNPAGGIGRDELTSAAPVAGARTRAEFTPGAASQGVANGARQAQPEPGRAEPAAVTDGEAMPTRGLSTAQVLSQGMRMGTVPPLPAGTFPLNLLIVESDATLLRPLMDIGRQMGFTVDGGTAAEMATRLNGLSCDVVLLDLMPGLESMDLLREVRRVFPRVPILVTTAFASVQTAVEAMRLGATDFLTKPFSLEELATTLQLAAERRSFDVELRRVQQQMRSNPAMQEVAAASPVMQKLLGMVTRVALSNHPVMVLGESGTGKERIARMLHAIVPQSKPAGGDAASGAAVPSGEGAEAALPFHHLLCATATPAMLETELFGYVRDEGTSVREERVGLLTVDGGGTLFLDEVDALSLDLQAKLLRALQNKSVRAPGSAMARPVTVRVVVASNRDLAALVERGAFRKDLYFRLNVVNLRVPSLRQRREDIPLLAAVFLERHGRERAENYSLGPDAMRVLLEYPWPGNVRELEAVIERACSLSSGPVLHVVDLPSQLQQEPEDDRPLRIDGRVPVKAIAETPTETPIESIADMERRAILATLDKLNGDKLMAAKLLGIGKTTLYRKLKEYGIAEV